MKIYGGKSTSINYLKVVSWIGAIKRIIDFVPTSTLRCIYNALIQSQLGYCNIVYIYRVIVVNLHLTGYRSFRTIDWKDLSTQFQVQKAFS